MRDRNVPSGEGSIAERFLSSFRVLVETDGGPAVKLELAPDQQMRTRREDAARRRSSRR